MEVLGRYSNLWDQGERLKTLLEIVPEAPKKVKARTRKQIQRRLDRADVALLVDTYDRGIGVNDLAKLFRIHRETVSSILDREHVVRRPKGVNDRLDEIIELYGDGMSLQKIATKFGANHNTVRNALLRAEVILRPRPGWKY